MPPWLSIHPVRVLAAFAVTAALLFGARTAWQARQVDRPLLAALEAVPGVEAVRAGRTAGVRVFEVTLGPVTDLQRTYRALDRTIADRLGAPATAYRLTVRDDRDEALEAVFFRIHFAVYEAAARSTFTDLAAVVAALDPADGVDRAEVRVDGRRIYLQLHRGDRYLYEVVPRTSPGAGASGGAPESEGPP